MSPSDIKIMQCTYTMVRLLSLAIVVLVAYQFLQPFGLNKTNYAQGLDYMTDSGGGLCTIHATTGESECRPLTQAEIEADAFYGHEMHSNRISFLHMFTLAAIFCLPYLTVWLLAKKELDWVTLLTALPMNVVFMYLGNAFGSNFDLLSTGTAILGLTAALWVLVIFRVIYRHSA